MKVDGVSTYNTYANTCSASGPEQASRDAQAAQEAKAAQAQAAEAEQEETGGKTVDDVAAEGEETLRMMNRMLGQMEEDKRRFRDLWRQAGEKSNPYQAQTSKPSDKSGNLTRRLVTASGQFEVRQITAEAGSQIAQLRMIAGTGSKEDAAIARAAIKKLERLLSRASKKIKALDNEDLLKIQKSKAELGRQQKRAERIKEELRRKRTIRQAHENAYLLDRFGGQMLGLRRAESGGRLDCASEASLELEAQAIAAAELSAGVAVAGEGGGAGGGQVAACGGEGAGGGEVAEEGGGVDISV